MFGITKLMAVQADVYIIIAVLTDLYKRIQSGIKIIAELGKTVCGNLKTGQKSVLNPK